MFGSASINERNDIGDFYVLSDDNDVFYEELAGEEPIHTSINDINLETGMVHISLVEWSGLSCVKVMDVDDIFQNSLQSVLTTNFPIFLLILIICLAICAVTARVFSLRVERIVEQMELLETGDFGNIIDSKTDDELAVIERGLNQMSSRLQAHIETCLLTEE